MKADLMPQLTQESLPFATEAEAFAGTSSTTIMTPERVRQVMSSAGEALRLENFGGKANDRSYDNGPALRMARDYIFSHGGGELRLGGEYEIKTLRNGRMVEPAPNMTIRGTSKQSALRLGDNVAGAYFHCIAVQNNNDDCTGFECRDFILDGNAANNMTTDYTSGIGIYVGSDIVVDGMTIKNHPGSQQISIGLAAGLNGLDERPTARRTRVTNNTILNCGYVVNMSNITDSSAIYIVCEDGLVTGNIILNDAPDLWGTAIELHGTGVHGGNVIHNYAKAYNIGSYPHTHWIAFGSRISEIMHYATFWNTLGVGYPSFRTSVVLTGDHVTTSRLPTNGSFIDAANFITSAAFASSLQIKGHFEFDVAPGNANTQPWLLLGKFHECHIHDSFISSYPGNVVLNGGISDAGTSVSFTNNKLLNVCSSSSVIIKTAVLIDSGVGNSLTTFVGTGNSIENSGGTYATQLFGGSSIPSGARRAIANNVLLGVADVGP